MKINHSISKLIMIAIVAAVYFVAAKLGLALAFINASTTAVWPPTGIAIAALLILGYRAFPGVLLGAFVTNATITGFTATTIGISIGNTLEGFAGVYLINRFAHGIQAFDRAQDVFKFAVLAGLISTMVSATIGVGSLALGANISRAEWGSVWLTWWFGDATGAMILTPVIVLWSLHPRPSWNWQRWLEAAAIVAIVILLGFAVYGGFSPIGSKTYPLQYLIFPILIWTAFRFTPREAATIALIISAVAIWGTLSTWSGLAKESENELLLTLQTFMSIVAITGIALAALVSEQRHIEDALWVAHETLADRVDAQQDSLMTAKERLQLYADIIKNIPIGLSVIELENPSDLQTLRILDLNPNTAQILGIKAEDYIGKYLKDVSPQTFEQGTDKIYAEILRDNKPRDFGEVRSTDPKIPAECFAARIFPLPKNRVTVTLEDITARKQIAETLNQQKQLYETLLKAQSDVGDGVAITEGDHIVYANEAFAKIYGFPKDEVLAIPSLYNLVAPEERARLMELQRRRDGGGTAPGRGETVIVRKNGERVAIEYVVQTIQVNGRQQSISITRDITERRRAEESLRESEEKFRLLFEGIKDYAIVSIDPKGIVLSWNEGAERIYGYRAEEMLGQSFSQIYPPEEARDDKLQIELQIATELSRFEIEDTRLRKDGSRFIAHVITTALEDADGKLTGFVRIARDITERKRAEEKFKGLLESAPDAMVIVDSDGRIQIVNSQTEKLFGYKRDELLGQSVEMLIPERFRGNHLVHRADYFTNPKIRTMGADLDLAGLRKDRREFPIDVSLSPLETEEGILITAAVRDITERKLSEGLLRQQQDLNETLVQVQSDVGLGVAISDGTHFIYVNEALGRIFGLTREELLALPSLLDIAAPTERQRLAEILRRRLDESSSDLGELEVTRRDGHRIWFEFAAKLIREENQARLIAVIRDVTERKRAQELLQQSEASLRALSRQLVDSQENERRRLARELHDEFGQTLTGLKMVLDAGVQLSHDGVKEHLLTAQSQVSELLSQVRDLSRELRPAILDDLGLLPALVALVERYTAQTRIQVDFKQRGLEARRFPSPVEITVYRVVQEALTNVARYAHVSKVRLRIWANHEALQLRIEDQGTGFDLKQALIAGKSSGLLGMRERIYALGGKIEMESSPGSGTRITVEIRLPKESSA